MEYSGQAAGMQGSSSKLPPWRLRPRMLSRPARYIQPAEPVYHVPPPRPTCGGTAETSAHTTYGSTLYRCAAAEVRALSIGLRNESKSAALSPSRSLASASTDPLPA